MVGGASDVVLYVVAIAAAIWIAVPAIAYSLGGPRLRSRAARDPAAAEPKGNDPDYERRFRQFEALGFRAAGTSRETCWFINNHKWFWRSRGTRWMTAPDGKMLVSFHRMLDDEPVRFGIVSTFERGGLVRSTCPGAGATHDGETYLRVEFPSIEPEQLLAKHKEHLEAFSRRRGRTVATASLEEAVSEELTQDRKLLSERGQGGGSGRAIFYLAGPALVASRMASLHGPVWRRAAIGVCFGGVLAAVSHFVIDPLLRRRRLQQARLAAVVAQRPAPGNLDRDMRARFEFAKGLLRDNQLDEATEQLEWLWTNMVRKDPAMHGVRLSYLVTEIKTLILAHPPARRRFEEIRAATGATADANPGLHSPRLDWVVINDMLGDDDSTIAWFDAVKGDPLSSLVFEAVGDNLTELLKRRGRTADICRIYPDPMARLEHLDQGRRMADLPLLKKRLGQEAFDQIRGAMARNFQTAVVDLVTSLRAAGRNDDAAAVRAKALTLDPTDEMKQALDRAPEPTLN